MRIAVSRLYPHAVVGAGLARSGLGGRLSVGDAERAARTADGPGWHAFEDTWLWAVLRHESDRLDAFLEAGRGLPGLDATAAVHLDTPERTVAVLAEGLRAFHEIDTTGYPFDHRIASCLAHVAQRVAAGDVDPEGFHDVHRHLDADSAFARLRDLAIEDDDIVVCHGDYCPPNIMIDDGRAVGFLDLGEAGLADRWRDLAVATWSVTWNFGPGHEELFLSVYGTEWDAHRRDLYRLLYDLES